MRSLLLLQSSRSHAAVQKAAAVATLVALDGMMRHSGLVLAMHRTGLRHLCEFGDVRRGGRARVCTKQTIAARNVFD